MHHVRCLHAAQQHVLHKFINSSIAVGVGPLRLLVGPLCFLNQTLSITSSTTGPCDWEASTQFISHCSNVFVFCFAFAYSLLILYCPHQKRPKGQVDIILFECGSEWVQITAQNVHGNSSKKIYNVHCNIVKNLSS